MPDLAEFGRRLKTVMEERGETPTTLAPKIGLSPQAIHKWLSGKDVSLTNLRLVAGVLDVNWLWLRYGENVTSELPPAKFKSDEEIAQLRQKLFDDVMASDKRRRWALEAMGIGLYESDLINGRRQWGPHAKKLLHLPHHAVPSPEGLRQALGAATAEALEALGRKAAGGGRHYLHIDSASRPGVTFEVCMELIFDDEHRPLRIYAMFRPFVEGSVTMRQMIEQVEEVPL